MDLARYLQADVVPQTAEGAVLVTCAALGSPASELAMVLALEINEVQQCVMEGGPLDVPTFNAASRWMSCLWWRTLFRLGHPAAYVQEEIDAVSLLASTLPFVPTDWQADHGRAIVLREVRDIIPWPTRQRGEANGRAKLTQEQVDEMRARWSRGRSSLRKLARIYEVSPSRVHRIVTKKAW